MIRRGLPDHIFICHECTFPICIIVTVHQTVVICVCVGGGGGVEERCVCNNILNARKIFCHLENLNQNYFYCDFHIFLADFKRPTHPLSGKIPLKNMKIDCRSPLMTYLQG